MIGGLKTGNSSSYAANSSKANKKSKKENKRAEKKTQESKTNTRQPTQSSTKKRTYIEPNVSTNPSREPWGCERRSAAIEGSTIDAMIDNDVETLCYRLQQVKNSSALYTVGTAVESLCALGYLAMFILEQTNYVQKAHTAFGAIFGTGASLAHAGVALQYDDVKNDCEKYLRIKFGEEFLKQINQCQINKKGIEKMITILNQHDPDISTLKLEKQLRKIETLSAQGMLPYLFNQVWQQFYPDVEIGKDPA